MFPRIFLGFPRIFLGFPRILPSFCHVFLFFPAVFHVFPPGFPPRQAHYREDRQAVNESVRANIGTCSGLVWDAQLGGLGGWFGVVFGFSMVFLCFLGGLVVWGVGVFFGGDLLCVFCVFVCF